MSRLSLLTKLLLAILLPMVLTFAGFGVFSHYAASRALEAELGRRLSGIAAVIATQIPPDSVALLAAGDEDSRTYRNLRRRLGELREAAGVARVYVFAADLTSRLDTDPESAPIGTRDYSLDASRRELRAVFLPGSGSPAASVLFRGRDGKLYKSGYAPIKGPEPAAQFAVGVDGSAALYAELVWLRRTLLGLGLSGVAALILLTVLWGRRMTLPLARLTASARTMGSGVLDVPMERRLLAGGDEVAVLAQGLEAMRQDLRARDERMQMMLAGIAHEVRNPLGGMELFAGLLQEELSGPVDGSGSSGLIDPTVPRGYVDKIQKELRHLQAVVSDFLDYARRPRPVLTQVALPELLREVAESAQARAKDAVPVVVEAPDPEACIQADTNQLRRALQNLAHNAVQACVEVKGVAGERDGQRSGVTLSAALSGGQAVLQVRDTGPGIPAEIVAKIWTPFFTTRAQGTGLGLAFTHEIITEHGGRIDVQTSAAGTIFTITLPLAAPT